MGGGGVAILWVSLALLWASSYPALSATSYSSFRRFDGRQGLGSFISTASWPRSIGKGQMQCAALCHTTQGCQSYNLGTASPYHCQLLTLAPTDTSVISSSFNQYIRSIATVSPVQTSNTGAWGSWHSWFYCSSGSFIHGVRIRYFDYYATGDADGISQLEVFCKYPDGTAANSMVIGVNDYQSPGTWLPYQECPLGTWIKAWDQAATPPQGGVDDDSLHNLIFHCSADLNGRSGVGTALTGTGDIRFPIERGECSFSTVACGMRLKVEAYQGAAGDNTAVNHMQCACCFIDLME